MHMGEIMKPCIGQLFDVGHPLCAVEDIKGVVVKAIIFFQELRDSFIHYTCAPKLIVKLS